MPVFLAIGYDPALSPMFRALGLGPKRSGVWIGTDSVRVKMGWGFNATIPRSAIRAISPDSATVTGWGVHGWRGRWLVNGASSGLVRLDLEPTVRAWAIGIPVRLRRLRISVQDPHGLLAALSDTR